MGRILLRRADCEYGERSEISFAGFEEMAVRTPESDDDDERLTFPFAAAYNAFLCAVRDRPGSAEENERTAVLMLGSEFRTDSKYRLLHGTHDTEASRWKPVMPF